MKPLSEVKSNTYKAVYNPDIDQITKASTAALNTGQANTEDLEDHKLDEPSLYENNLKNNLLEWAKVRSKDSEIDMEMIMFANNVISNISMHPLLLNQQDVSLESVSDSLAKVSQKTLESYPNISSALGYANIQDAANACGQIIQQTLQSEINTNINSLVPMINNPSGSNFKSNAAAIVTSVLEMLVFMKSVLESSAIQATVSANIARAIQTLNDFESFLGTVQKIYGTAGAEKVKDTDNKSDYTDWNDANRKYFEDAAKKDGSDFRVVDIINHNAAQTERVRLLSTVDQLSDAFKNSDNGIWWDKIIENSWDKVKINPPLTPEEKSILKKVFNEGLKNNSIFVQFWGDRNTSYHIPPDPKQGKVSPEEYDKYNDVVKSFGSVTILANMNLAKNQIVTLINNLPEKDIDFSFKSFGFSVAVSAIPESLRGFFSTDPSNPSNIIISQSDIYSTNKSNDAVVMATGALAFVSQIVASVVCSKSDSSIAGSYSDKYTNSNQLNNMISGINSYSQQVNNVATSLSSMISTLSSVSQQIAQTGSGIINTGQQSYNSLNIR